ncbi:DUF4185 domain-containing protein [Gordonia crocea]|uniref:DUF4185 domain-containing protein n=1 Tax=Gordonia crocea TaxID=589162 RepID=A0A7I9UX95_9ACTN|nr:DUF4185 domain-containing protein [Gordonia crocea]GED97506.1 hypothetical protein nbrc107697_15450 [Gordonia crocea]
MTLARQRFVWFAVSAALVASTALVPGSAHARILPSSGCVNDLPPKPKPNPVGPGDMVPQEFRFDLPYPRLLPVPEPGPKKKPVRIPSQQPPPKKKRCVDPCPDLTDPKKPKPSGANGSLGSLAAPKITFKLKPINIPYPVPNPYAPKLPPPPAKVNPGWDRAPLTPAPSLPRVRSVRWVSTLTGKGSTSRTDKRWQVMGTDLGIMWESKPGQIAVAFGDTFGKGFKPPGANGGDWRSNIIGFSSDRKLADGMSIDTMIQDSRCHAVQVVDARHINHYELTTIPTSGFAIGERQFMTYMSVRAWGNIPGVWLTNHGGLAYSDDEGSTWTRDPYLRWDNVFGTSQFQVASMVPQGDYVYMFGTPNSRLGSVGLARVRKDDVLNKTAYQYWRDGRWVPSRDANAASVLFGGPTGELSVRYNAETARWEMTYLDVVKGAIVLRTAREPQGRWSEPVQLVHSGDRSQLYGGFIHPWSSGNDLYFTLSQWSTYNVSLMRARVY